jgi:hypothetical protein
MTICFILVEKIEEKIKNHTSISENDRLFIETEMCKNNKAYKVGPIKDWKIILYILVTFVFFISICLLLFCHVNIHQPY